MSDKTTAEKILDTAERLFADEGTAAVSLRKIICKAGVNIAAVHYHFGSKEELIKAVFHRRLSAINEVRLNKLSELREKHADKPIPIEELLRAFLSPAIAFSDNKEKGGGHFFRLAARAHSEPDPAVQQVLFAELKDVIDAYIKELERSLPKLSNIERSMRLTFVAGAMLQAVLIPQKPIFVERFLGEEPSKDEMLEMLLAFCCDGIKGAGGKQ